MLCICAEQTFSQASARKSGFDHAFPIVLNAYMKSTVRDSVIKEIGMLFEGSPYEQLVDIITMHPIRMCSLCFNDSSCAHNRINSVGINPNSA